jgi:predicted histidine transporter YuiF (NhaC family)
MDILTNPVLVSVVVLVILCLRKVNVLISLLLSALVAGIMSGMPLTKAMSVLVKGMGGNSETALSYILLGILASAMANTGITEILSHKIEKVVKGKKLMFLVIIALVACCSQNVIPVHIAFIPILIPPLLKMMNNMKLDRRAVACSLAFGLKAPYISLPFGFGLIFHGLIAKHMESNGITVATSQVWHGTWPLGLSMILGLVVGWFIFRKDREYEDRPIPGQTLDLSKELNMEASHWVTLFAALMVLVINLYTGSLPLGALAGIVVMVVGRAIKLQDFEVIVGNGVRIMGLIAFVMLVAAGYSEVIKATGGVNHLVEASVAVVGNSKFIAAVMMMIIGLVVTIGIGSSFSTIPVIATLFVPVCMRMGFSPMGCVMLIAAAAALGDAGSPASDTTLGPTSGLNADGQHDHIWDTCVPTGILYNTPLALCAIILSPFI